MRFIKNNIFTILTLAFVSILAMSGNAFAQSDIVGLAQSKATNVFKAVKTIIFIVGGFGLVGIAFAAIFGKINFKWFAALAVGLAILAAAGSIVEYATGDSNVAGTSNFGDTFQNSDMTGK